jgi:hypothetical protein
MFVEGWLLQKNLGTVQTQNYLQTPKKEIKRELT